MGHGGITRISRAVSGIMPICDLFKCLAVVRSVSKTTLMRIQHVHGWSDLTNHARADHYYYLISILILFSDCHSINFPILF